jgi:hypothetical protein
MPYFAAAEPMSPPATAGTATGDHRLISDNYSCRFDNPGDNYAPQGST